MTLLLLACNQDTTPPTVTPTARVEASPEASPTPFPPAELRRALRACDASGASAVVEAEYGVRVDAAGRVTLVKALKSTLPPALLNCTLARIREWTFPASPDGAAFRFSMRFGEPPQHPAVADKKEIKATIKHRTSALQHCYNASLRQAPGLFGKVEYTLFIAADGHVTSASADVESQANLPTAMIECTLEKIRAWRFPMRGAEAGSSVSFSVVFTGDGTPEGYVPEGYRAGRGEPG